MQPWSLFRFWQSLIGMQSDASGDDAVLALPAPSPEASMPDFPAFSESSAPRGLAEPALDPNALRVLAERYLAKKIDGSVETPKEFLWRVAEAIAQPEAPYARANGRDPDASVEGAAHGFYDMLQRRDFLPNAQCLINAGRPQAMLSSCFALPVPDSVDGIFYSIKAAALVQKNGGTAGLSFSALRRQGADVSTGREASGPVSFMKAFNAAADSIKQDGTRRGVDGAVLRVDHPDIFSFLVCKKELDEENLALWNRLAEAGRYDDDERARLKQELLRKQLNNFTLSVGVTDAFLHAVENDEEFTLRDPRDASPVRGVRARDIWEGILDGARQTGEPNMLFLDHPEANPLPGLGPISAANPCGEQFLHGWDSCSLGSINVGHFHNPTTRDVDWDRLGQTAALAIRFLDNAIDVDTYPLAEIEQTARGNRRIGLGIMGFADLLIQLEIPYGSAEAIAFAAQLTKFIRIRAEEACEQLARERGEFPNKPLSIWANDPRPRRNAALLSTTSTNEISIIAGCSVGCEPYLSMTSADHTTTVPLFEEIAKDEGFYSEELLTLIEQRRGSVKGIADVPERWQRIFTTAADVTVDQHIDMLAAFQRWTCNAVSKIVAAPHDDTPENLSRAIFRAYRAGCKTFTYRRAAAPARIAEPTEPKEKTRTTIMTGRETGRSRESATANEEFDVDALLARANALLEAQS